MEPGCLVGGGRNPREIPQEGERRQGQSQGREAPPRSSQRLCVHTPSVQLGSVLSRGGCVTLCHTWLCHTWLPHPFSRCSGLAGRRKDAERSLPS